MKNEVLPNTTFEGISLEGKTKKEVKQLIHNKIIELKSKKMIIPLPNVKREFSYDDIGIVYKDETIVDQIFASQQKQGQWERIQLQKAAKKGERKKSYSLTQCIDPEKFNQFVDKKLNDYVIAPVNATVKLSADGTKFDVTASKNGKRVNKVQLSGILLNSLKNKNEPITIPVDEVQPKLTTEMANKLDINHIMKEYKTSLADPNSNSATNVKIAASKLNGTLLAPGEEFSYKKTLGRANAENGYKESTVFSNGTVLKGFGGGICQVVSTLYDAAMYADLTITARTNHSRRVKYVPIGLDATVDDDGPDLRFKNSYNQYIYIQSIVENGELVIRIYGKPMTKEVILTSTIDKETEQYIYASSYRTVKQNGTVIVDNQFIAKSRYHK
ncbi:VanW family protein (plasmid) [Bacillus mycoides]|nr:VanW family protein [Bacillus mycoides]